MSAENGNGEVKIDSPFAFVQPTPFSYSVNRVQLEGGQQAVQISWFHATGATTVICMPEEARQMANTIIMQSGGIVVPVSDQKLHRPGS